MTTAPAIAIKNLYFTYGRQSILKGIDLDIHPGFVSIIGPNGAGKTTLLRLTAGLLDLQTGSVRIQGRDISSLSHLERARCFTFIQQNRFFPFPFSCLEVVGLGRYPHRKKVNGLDAEDMRIILHAMQVTETLKFKDRLITELSGGEQQRILLACALAQQPQILFLDEAFSAVDIAYKASLLSLLKKLVAEEQLTVVAIQHDLNLAYRYSDSVCILKNGELVGSGPPQHAMTAEVVSEVFSLKVELVEGRCFIY